MYNYELDEDELRELTVCNPAQRRFCGIMCALASDDAVERGIICRDKAEELLKLTILIGREPQLRFWLGLDKRLQLSRVASLIGWLHAQGFFKRGKSRMEVSKVDVAKFLTEDGAMPLSFGSLVTGMSTKVSKVIAGTVCLMRNEE